MPMFSDDTPRYGSQPWKFVPMENGYEAVSDSEGRHLFVCSHGIGKRIQFWEQNFDSLRTENDNRLKELNNAKTHIKFLTDKYEARPYGDG